MTITFNGANSVVIQTKNGSILTDPFPVSYGKMKTKIADIVLITDKESAEEVSGEKVFQLDGPGEYEILNNSITGIPAKRHIDTDDNKTTIYKIVSEGMSIVFFGHIDSALSEKQYEEIGIVDIAIIPVGGNGYTLDAEAAAKIIKEVEPKLVIPTHYELSGINYPVPQNNLAAFLSELGVNETQKEEKLKLKDSMLPDNLQVIELTV